MNYHPDYFNKEEKKSLRVGCKERLNNIRQHVRPGALFDIGCSNGYYSFGLSDICDRILAVDREQTLINQCNDKKKEYDVKGIKFKTMNITYNSIEGMWTNVLYLSIHHHVIAQLGYEAAAKLLMYISMYGKVMFFDMGQKNEKGCEGYNWWKMLPETKDIRGWLYKYLRANTIFSNVQEIGSSFVHGVRRILWKLEK